MKTFQCFISATIFYLITTGLAHSAAVLDYDDEFGIPIAQPLVVKPFHILKNDKVNGINATDAKDIYAVLVSGVSNGSLKCGKKSGLCNDGSFVYTPGIDFNGIDSFTYKAVVGSDESSVSTVILSACSAHGTIYTCWNENAYISKLTELGFNLFREGFETTAWDIVRSPNTASSIVSKGITWSTNFAVTNGISTGIKTGTGDSWAGFDSSHGVAALAETDCDIELPPAGCFRHDGLSGSGTGLFGVGGYIHNTGAAPANISVILDGIPHRIGKKELEEPEFFGVIQPTGFTTFQFREQDGKVGQENPVFIDNVIISTSNAVPVNNVPELIPVDSRVAKVNRTLRIAVTAIDPDIDDSFKFRSSALPAGATFEDNFDGTATFIWRPDYTQVGDYPISFTVTDNGFPAGSDTEELTIKVNHPPVIKSTPVRTAIENNAYSYTLMASDVDDEVLTYSDVSNPALPGWIKFAPESHILRGIPTGSDVGAFTVTLRATDSNFNINQSFKITVNALNKAPVADIKGTYTMAEGSSVLLDASGSSDADGNALSYSWDLDNDGVFDDAMGTTATFNKQDNGSYPVVVNVSDGLLSSSASTTVIVNDLGPKATVSGDNTLNEGVTGSYNASSSSSSPDKIVSYQWDLDNNGNFTDASGVSISHSWPDNGSYVIAVKVTDDDGSSNIATLNVSVNDLQPIAVLKGDTILNEGATGSYKASESSSSQDSIVSYQWDLNNNGNFTDASGASITHSWPDNGSYVIAVKVTDDDGSSDIATTTVTVNNLPPAVNAGTDQSVKETDSVKFSGSFSDPGSLDSHTIVWDFGDNSAEVKGTLTPGHVYVNPGQYTVTLHVTDKDMDTASSTLIVTVDNVAPVAIAGQQQRVQINEQVNLNGSSSFDLADSPLIYTWSIVTKPAGSTVKLTDATTVNSSFVADTSGTYAVQLIVNDGIDNSHADTVTISVNSAPVANAGEDQTTAIANSVMLDGSGSNDVDGDELKFSWSLISKPAGSTTSLSSSSAVKPNLLIDQPGKYDVQLVVNDGFVDSLFDTVSIRTINQTPVANAGTGQIAHVSDTITLDGSGSSDADGDELLFSWLLTGKPEGSTASLSNATSASPKFVVDRVGSYEARLVVNDNQHNSTPDTVIININNRAPQANIVGTHEMNEGASVLLDVSGSIDADGDALSYSWDLNNDGVFDDTAGTTATFSSRENGSYPVSVKVSDGLVSSIATTLITVHDLTPIAVLNGDSILNEGETGSFTASKSSSNPDVIISYEWDLNNDGSFTDADGVSISHSWPDNGSFAIAVKVTDDDGSIDIATTTVTVNNVAPEVNTDPGQTVNEAETVKFSGSFIDQGLMDTHTIQWNFGDGSEEVTGTLTPTHAYMKPGLYIVTLRVTDKDQGTASNTLILSVSNLPPVAVAGMNQSVQVNALVNLDGSSSFDISDAPLSYAWSIMTKPIGSSTSLKNATTVNPSFVADVAGIYVVQLIVNEGIGNSVADTVTISTK